jgi:hypothetical protein
MVLIEIDIGDGSFIVRLPGTDVVRTWRDSITLRGGDKILGVGETPDEGRLHQGDHAKVVTTRPALSPRSFEPALAAAMIDYTTADAMHADGVTWRMLLGESLRITCPGWSAISRADRHRFVELLRATRVEINGVVVRRRRLDLPVVGWMVGGTWISPDA